MFISSSPSAPQFMCFTWRTGRNGGQSKSLRGAVRHAAGASNSESTDSVARFATGGNDSLVLVAETASSPHRLTEQWQPTSQSMCRAQARGGRPCARPQSNARSPIAGRPMSRCCRTRRRLPRRSASNAILLCRRQSQASSCISQFRRRSQHRGRCRLRLIAQRRCRAQLLRSPPLELREWLLS
jgi:hypothetical protein